MTGRRVVCAGGAVNDLKLHLSAGSVLATSNPAAASSSFGGVARNVAENLSVLLGGPVDLVSCVGDDAAGAALLEHARGCGIGVGHVRVVPGVATAQYVAVLEPSGELTIGAAAMAVLDQVSVAQLDAALAGGRPGWLFCDTNLTEDVLAHALSMGRAGLPVAVDAVSTAKVRKLPADLSGLGLLCCNRDEALTWLAYHGFRVDGSDTSLAEQLCAAGAASVVLTLGAAGLLVATSTTVDHVPAFTASPIDVTGAGDALVAGMLAALLAGADLVEAARSGAARAARTIESSFSVLPSGELPG